MIAFVQAKTAQNDATATSIAATFDSPVTAGGLIVVATGRAALTGDRTVGTVTDTLTNSYTKIVSDSWDSSNSQCGQLFYAFNVAGGANTVTYSFTPTKTFRRIAIVEYSGVLTTDPFDDQAFHATVQSSSGTPTSPAVTPGFDNVLLLGWLQATSIGGVAYTAGATWTERADTGATGVQVEEKLLASPVSTQATWTQSPASAYIAGIIAFREAAEEAADVRRARVITSRGTSW